MPRFLILLFLATPTFAQLEITGRVFDADKHPLAGVNIIAKGILQGTISDQAGAFRFKTNLDSVFLQFSFIGYKSQTLKFRGSSSVEVILKEIGDPSDGPWNLVRGKEPIYKKKGKEFTTEVYAETTVQLPVMASGRRATWQVNEFTVSVPFDSLRKFIDLHAPENESLVKHFQNKKENENLSLPESVVKKLSRPLNDFAIDMIKSNSLAISAKDGTPVKVLQVKDVYWQGNNCTLCCWGGIVFDVPGTGNEGTTLFSITTFIC